MPFHPWKAISRAVLHQDYSRDVAGLTFFTGEINARRKIMLSAHCQWVAAVMVIGPEKDFLLALLQVEGDEAVTRACVEKQAAAEVISFFLEKHEFYSEPIVDGSNPV